jgi:hypothetical protein
MTTVIRRQHLRHNPQTSDATRKVRTTERRKRKNTTYVIEHEVHVQLEAVNAGVKASLELALDGAKVHRSLDDLAILRNA